MGGLLSAPSSGPESDGCKAAMKAFKAMKREGFPKLAAISAKDLIPNDAYKNYTFVDARSHEEMSVSMIPGAIRLDEFLSGPVPDKKIVFYCALGGYAGAAAQDFAQKVPIKEQNVLILAGALCAWTHHGGRLVDGAGNDTKRVHVWSKANADLFPTEYEAIFDPPPHTNGSRGKASVHDPSDSERYAEAQQWFDDELPRQKGVTHIEAEDLLKNDAYKRYVMVDVRSLEERTVSTIPGSVPVDAFLENERPAGKIVFFCNSGGRAGTVAQQYLQHYPHAAADVLSFKLSLVGWAHHNGPFVDASGKATKKVHSTKTWFPREFETVNAPSPVTKPANDFVGAHKSHKAAKKPLSRGSQSPKSAKKRSSQVNRERYVDAKSWFDSNILPTQSGVTQIEAEALLQRDAYKRYTMVDCRSLEETNVSVIPGAIALDTFLSQHSQRRHEKIVFYCTVGARSGKLAAEYSKRHPDAAVANFKLSLVGWCHNSGPLVDGAGISTKKVHSWGTAQVDNFPVDMYDIVFQPAPTTNPIAAFDAISKAPAKETSVGAASNSTPAKETSVGAASNSTPAKQTSAGWSESRQITQDDSEAESDGEREGKGKGKSKGKGKGEGEREGKGKKGKGKGKKGKGKGKKGKYFEPNSRSDWYQTEQYQ